MPNKSILSKVRFLIKHKDVVNCLPILQKLEAVYAIGDGKGGFYKQPAIALAVIKDEDSPGVTYLAPNGLN